MAPAHLQLRLRMIDLEDLDAAYSLADERPEIDLEATAGKPGAGIEGQAEPISAILITAGAVAVIKFALDWWEKRRGGLVIDQRPSAKDQLYRDAELPYGLVVVFAATGGQVQVQTYDMPKDAMHQLLEAVVSGAYKSVADLAKLMKETVPKAVVQETQDIRSA
jgi:hypothetical protein